MKTKLYTLAATVLVHVSLGLTPAGAQSPGLPGGLVGPGQYKPPAVSPYLNLLRPGDPAINYFGLVRPQQDFRNGIQGLNTAFGAVQSQAVLQEGQEFPLGTGHASNYMTQGKFFMTRGSRVFGPGTAGMRPGAGSSAVSQQGIRPQPPTTAGPR